MGQKIHNFGFPQSLDAKDRVSAWSKDRVQASKFASSTEFAQENGCPHGSRRSLHSTECRFHGAWTPRTELAHDPRTELAHGPRTEFAHPTVEVPQSLQGKASAHTVPDRVCTQQNAGFMELGLPGQS